VALSVIPYYLLAVVLIFLFSTQWQLLPGAQGYDPTRILGFNTGSALDIGRHAILPALSIVLGSMGFWALSMRGMMVSVLGDDYITFAESKGLSPRRIFLWYGMRNALLPQITALAVALGLILSGAVLVEVIFNYPGLGYLLYNAIEGKDYFVIQGIVLMLIICLALALYVVDLIYPLLDPRITYHRR
jgi:peptide/nickel transport system permease protein